MAQKKKTSIALTAQSDPRAPLDGAAFLVAAQRMVATLRDDLLARADGSPGVAAALRAQWQGEREARRTGDEWDIWRRRVVVQVAAAWVLSLVFARTLEDRGLVERNRIAGPGAIDSQDQFRALAPYLTDRDYLLTVFRELANLPAAKDLFDPTHNPVWKLGPSIEGARALLELFRAPDPETPAFRFGQSDTRFLGDLYQDLDEETRERFALLQTPRFVESFILDQTLEPAIREFGLDGATLIDPTCGSGHFLLGGFERFVDHWLRERPGIDLREAARKALDAVYGVDINPYAVAIARFRLALALLEKGGYTRIDAAPELPLHVVVADSLLHGRGSSGQASFAERRETVAKEWFGAGYDFVDESAAKGVLGQQYAAVVGNPPFIQVQDPILRDAYRAQYASAAGKYTLSAPFTERFFELARPNGFVGLLNANAFMRRSFGKVLVERILPTLDVTAVIDAADVHLPGPPIQTLLLFGRRRPPVRPHVRAILSRRGEIGTPQDPAHGLVWLSILEHGNDAGYEDEYISVVDLPRSTLSVHPWSLGGGGARELKDYIEGRSAGRLKDRALTIGIACVTGEDDAYVLPISAAVRLGIERTRPIVVGESVRDWYATADENCAFPYDDSYEALPIEMMSHMHRLLWPSKPLISHRKRFGTPMLDRGARWYELQELYDDKLRAKNRVTYAEVASHNHFAFDDGGRIFKSTARVITFPDSFTHVDVFAILGYLNSSTACFWLKQVAHQFGTSAGDVDVVKGKPESKRFAFQAQTIAPLPMPNLDATQRQLLAAYASEAHTVAARYSALSGTTILASLGPGLAAELATAKERKRTLLQRLVVLQEDIDWLVYSAFGLREYEPSDIQEAAPEVRPFCGLSESRIWASRKLAIEKSSLLRILETSAYKRPWIGRRGIFGHNVKSFETQIREAAEGLIEEKLEEIAAASGDIVSLDYLDRMARKDSAFARASAVVSAGDEAATEAHHKVRAVPYLASLRCTSEGLEKRAIWVDAWDRQRRRDAGENVVVPIPPKYGAGDFREPIFWQCRGRLDVATERFISYPGCESDEDKAPVYGWAGWDHLQQAIALATLYMKRKHGEAWEKERLIPMLAGLDELLPWVWQWHPEPTAESGGMKPGQYIADFLAAQCHELGVTDGELRAWHPDSGRKKATSPATKKRASKKAALTGEEEAP